MIKIPNKFKVFASTINVGFDNTRLSNEGVLGDCSFTDGQINICKEYKGEEISDCCALDTFYHEKVHIILDAMGEHELSKNEKFVEVFARLLRQTDESAEFEQVALGGGGKRGIVDNEQSVCVGHRKKKGKKKRGWHTL